MRQAPPVGVTCSGRGGWRLGGALLCALAAADVAAWSALRLDLGGAIAAACAPAAAALAASIAWRLTPPRSVELRWDGRRWQTGGIEGEVDVMLDLGAWMLLRLRPPTGRAHWLPLSRAEAGAAWHPLRAALFARAAAEPAPAGEEA